MTFENKRHKGKMMKCDCDELKEFSYLSDLPKNFESRLEHLENTKIFKILYRCKFCGQHWSIDVWDKYEISIAVKIKDVTDWEKIDYDGIKYDLFASSKGGYSDELCSWNNCSEKSVKGKAFCPYHCFYISNSEQ